MTTTATASGAPQAAEKTDRADRALLKELVKAEPANVRAALKELISEAAINGDTPRVGAFSRLARELFPPAAKEEAVEVKAEVMIAAAAGPGSGDMCRPAASTKPVKAKQLELPAAKPEPEEEEVEEEEVDEEEEVEDGEEDDEEEEEEEEPETPPPPIKPFKLGGKKPKKK